VAHEQSFLELIEAWDGSGVVVKHDELTGSWIFIALHDLRLLALNARTGELYPDFGDAGLVDLSGSLGREVNPVRLTHSSPVAIARDVVVIGSIVQDTNLILKEASPGHVRGFDARTGEMKWIFHTIPQEGELGVDTWEDDSWRYSGHTNVWGTLAVDDELGLVYLPTGTPTNDYYGGMRRGDNLFAESIVAVDIETHKHDSAAICEAVCGKDPQPGKPLSRHVKSEKALGQKSLYKAEDLDVRWSSTTSQSCLFGQFGL